MICQKKNNLTNDPIKKKAFGENLNIFLHDNNMLIVNDRIGDTSGHFTCKNASVVDYNISCP